MRVAVLGLGEAGAIYAADLADRGATVLATDPASSAAPTGVTLVSTIAEAVGEADIVLSIVGAKAAASVLADAAPAMQHGALFADMNTGSPDDKRTLAQTASSHDVAFVDVAILAPVPRARAATPLLVSGGGAARLRAQLDGLGIPVTDVGTEPGAAASLKLLRSVFMKGLAALVFETLAAAETVGAEVWARDQVASELGPDGAQFVDRLVDGTRAHAERREAEMRDALAYLDSLDSPRWMTEGTVEWLSQLAREPRPAS